MNQEQFNLLAAEGYNRIPVSINVLADLETPLSSYLKLARGPYSYLFESVQGGEKWGRYSFIGLPCRTVLKAYGELVTVITDGHEVERVSTPDPLAFVENFKARFKALELPHLPRFNGGLVGYFGYDCVRYVEPRLKREALDPLGTPDILLMVSDEVVVFDNLSGTLSIIVMTDPAQPDALQKAQSRLAQLQETLAKPVPKLPIIGVSDKPEAEAHCRSCTTQESFYQSVERIKEYILAGDIMQVVLSQRLELDFDQDPLNLYRVLRRLNPSPNMYFLALDDHHVVGSSPEILVRLQDGDMTVRPIAGTRRRGRDEEEDQRLAEELQSDPKELAEHLMLIDLGRNDVGRVAQTGSVQLTEKMVIERYSHVMHITSNVTGKLKPGLGAIDALKAALPAGTLSGAPKIRAMEIIDELEPLKRCIYGGAVGYLAWNGNMDTAIAIRTAVIKEGKVYIQTGAGVVADSKPELEWKETMNKARALLVALDQL